MNPLWWLPIGYLAGSMPFGFSLVRGLRGVDIREVGSGNAGATNVLRTVGTVPALFVLVLDVAKGALPVAAALYAGAKPWVAAAVALAAVLGHMFPIYVGFRGGKGVATALGGLAALTLWPTVAGVAVILALVAWKRYVSLGSMTGVCVIPLAMIARGHGSSEVGFAVAVAAFVVWKHRDNIRRLRSGDERRLGERVEVAQ